MEDFIKIGEPCGEDKLNKAGYHYDHSIGECQIWVSVNGHTTWLFRQCDTEIVKYIITNYN